MTDREALERALEALREIGTTEIAPWDARNVAIDVLHEIQRGRWIETVNRQVDLEEFCAARGISP